MPGARRAKKGQTGKRPNAQIKRADVSASGPDAYDGREQKGQSNVIDTTPKPLSSGRVVDTQ